MLRKVLLGVTIVCTLTVGLALGITLATPSADDIAEAAPPSQADQFACVLNDIGIFDDHIHLHCITGTDTGIDYFAVPNYNRSVDRYLDAMITAYETNSTVFVFYTENDLSGTAYGCKAENCRPIRGLEIVK